MDGADFIGTFRDPDGTSYEARRLAGTTGWLVESAAPLDGLILYGQSNAGIYVASDTNGNLRHPLFPHTVVESSLHPYGNEQTTWPDTPAPPFTDLYDPPEQVGHLPATLDAYAAEQFARDAGRGATGLYAYSQFQSGQPLEAFVKGSFHYNALLAEVRRTTASARLYKRSFAVRGIVFIQGETPSGDYEVLLERLADDLAADIRAITGQTTRPELLIQQINTFDAQPRVTGVELAQLSLAQRRAGSGITMIGPMYQGRFGAGDPIHVSDLGKMALADVAGLVFDRVRRGIPFTPLWPVAISRSGADIDVKFAVPGKGLAFDTDFLPTVPAQGFVYQDNGGGANIAAVRIVGADTVRVTLDRVPTGGDRRLHYALGSEAVTDLYAAGRGNLYSEDSASSVYARLGYPVPLKVRHYAVRFLLTVP